MPNVPLPSPLSARRWPGLALALALGAALTLGLLAGLRPAYARPLAGPPPVNSDADSGAGSLREALANAVDGDTITFDLPPNSTIVVTSSLTVTAAVTIDGATAANLTLSGGDTTRVFSVTAPLHLISLTVTGGQANGSGGGLYSTSAVTLTNVIFRANTATDGRGGGLFTLGRLALNNASFLTNTTTFTTTPGVSRGGGAYTDGDAVVVGGLFLNNRTLGVASAGGLGATGSVTISGTQFVSNTAGDSGGGLRAGQADLTNVTLRDNYAGSIGGGLFVAGAAALTDTLVTGNRAAFTGGGARFNGAALVLGGSFSGNQSGTLGGAVFAFAGLSFSGTAFLTNTAAGDGGGLYVVGGPLVGEAGLLRGNTAGGDGGGLLAFSGAQLTATQFISNSAADAGGGLELAVGDGRLVNLLVARNTAGGLGSGLGLSTAGEVTVLYATIVADANPGAAIAVQAGTVTLTNTLLAGHAVGLSLLGGAAAEDYTLFYSTTLPISPAVGLGPHSFSGNPRFVNPAADDYHLGPASAAANSGADAGVAVDFEGQSRPFAGAFDIGADERRLLELFLPWVSP